MTWQDEISPDIKPGDDFYNYVNQKWRKANPIPDNKSRVAAFTVLNDENMERLRLLLESDEKKTETVNIQQVKSFYHAAMDEKAIAAAGIKPIQPLLDAIGKLKTRKALEQFVTAQHARGQSCIWKADIDVDDKNSSRYVVRFLQAGLGLPDRDYYFEKDKRFIDIRQQYKLFLNKFFALIGSNHPERCMTQVLAVERKLARASATAVEKRDVEAMYNLYTVGKLNTEFPGIDWDSYLLKLEFTKLEEIVISQPKFIRSSIQLLGTQSIEAWRSYLTFHALLPLLDKLSKEYEDLKFDFYNRILQGAQEPEPRYRRMIGLSMSVLPEPLGQLFIDNHFDESAKHEMYDLVGRLQEALRRRIQRLEWMSEGTKKRALEKLDTFLPLLGYPDKWKDYAELTVGKSFVNNYIAAIEFGWKELAGRVMEPVDRKEWLMSPAMVNAYYWSNTNGITFPAGILQPPFFDSTGDFAANYGAIGVVIGHEMTHGFDDKGSKFDKEGNLRSWWDETDRQAFDQRAQGLEKQYSSYKVDGRKVNGKLTLGENIADLGGVLIAYDAFEQKLHEKGSREQIDDCTPEQRFFMNYLSTSGFSGHCV